MRKDYVTKLEKFGISYWSENAITWDARCDVIDDFWTDTGKIEIDI
jgi:hypothetical protein